MHHVLAWQPDLVTTAVKELFVTREDQDCRSALLDRLLDFLRYRAAKVRLFGLGQTTPEAPFGQITPVGPIFRLTPPLLDCADETDPYTPFSARAKVEVLFAGLAPGILAVYQVDWRIPSSTVPYDHFVMRSRARGECHGSAGPGRCGRLPL